MFFYLEIFLMILEQTIFLNKRRNRKAFPPKQHLQKMHILQNKDADSASFSILAIHTTFLSTPNKELITHETVGSNLHTFNPMQEAAALFTIKMIGVGSRDILQGEFDSVEQSFSLNKHSILSSLLFHQNNKQLFTTI